MSDGGFLFRNNNDETSTISVLNEMRSIPTIYANKNVTHLGGILQFGYSHKFQEKKHYHDIIKPTLVNLRQSQTSFHGSSKALSLSIQDGETSSLFQSKLLSPIKSHRDMKSHRLFTNKLAAKANEVKPAEFKEPETSGYTTDQLDEIRKIHELHFKLKRA